LEVTTARIMEPQYGAEVIDKNGRKLGKISYLVRDTWDGGIKKFMIYRKPPEKDLTFSPEDASEITESTVKLNIAVEETDESQ
jgi:sporulation protein YlmC with PRC-barrel domain